MVIENTVLIIALMVLCLALAGTVIYFITANRQRISDLDKSIARMEQLIREENYNNRRETSLNAKELREELVLLFDRHYEAILSSMSNNAITQLSHLELFAKNLQTLTGINENRLEKLRETVERQLTLLQTDNNKKLEEMRQTVDSKLNETLEKRLGDSFKLVSERLELVHKGLGEMQALATGVGDLKRVLTNVKSRGIWGEIQLETLLEQVLSCEQYEKNVATVPGSNERVEFAIKLPGREKSLNVVWLPIDAKFPQEDYQRLVEAQEQLNTVVIDEAGKALEQRIKQEAKCISQKYLSVPYTTDFAIMFLPIEGLYAEVLRRPGLCDVLMREYRVIITGPTTLAALLNSLQMGFRTLAIEKRSSEVWSLLGAVKTEFGKFGDLLDKTNKKLQEASNSLDTATRKSRTIVRKLNDVQELQSTEVVKVLGLDIEESS